jgi:tetratricopeptide (TPR) repeat protein
MAAKTPALPSPGAPVFTTPAPAPAAAAGPKNWREWHQAGVKAAIAGDQKKAIECFDKSIAAESDLKYVGPWPFYSRGQAYEKLGDKAKAKADFKQACDLKLDQACKGLAALK